MITPDVRLLVVARHGQTVDPTGQESLAALFRPEVPTATAIAAARRALGAPTACALFDPVGLVPGAPADQHGHVCAHMMGALLAVRVICGEESREQVMRRVALFQLLLLGMAALPAPPAPPDEDRASDAHFALTMALSGLPRQVRVPPAPVRGEPVDVMIGGLEFRVYDAASHLVLSRLAALREAL